MKLGTENKTKTAIAVGLLAVAAFVVYNWLSSGGQDSVPAATTTAASSSAALDKKTTKPAGRKAGPVMLAESLDGVTI